jgi:hypothetical protein
MTDAVRQPSPRDSLEHVMVDPGPAQPGPGMPPPAATANRLPLILGIVVGVLLLCCTGGGTALVVAAVHNPDRFAAADRPAPATTDPALPPTVAAPEPSPTAQTTTAPPAKAPADVVYQGRGTRTVRLKPLSEDYAHYAVITHNGSSNFAIWSLDSGGEEIDLVVNDVGSYQGARPLDFEDDTPAALRIEADGAWKIVVKVLDKAPRWPAQKSGKGPAVLLLGSGAGDDPTTAAVTHKGQDNFVVHAYGDSTDLLVNEIGKFSGEVLIPAGTVAIAIEADGSWTMKPS